MPWIKADGLWKETFPLSLRNLLKDMMLRVLVPALASAALAGGFLVLSMLAWLRLPVRGFIHGLGSVMGQQKLGLAERTPRSQLPDYWSIASMQGYVLVFRPTTGNGTIVTDAGAEVRFAAAGDAVEFEGGDIVSFQLERPCEGAEPSMANDIRVVQRWSDRLAASGQSLLRQLHSVVQIDAFHP
jgi:hypothetical protein